MTKIHWLRISYWVGAIADAVLAIRMLMPDAMGEPDFRYAMGTSAALMLGWTFLLIWADRRPVERKGILLLTIFPVISGLMASSVYPFAIGAFSLGRVLPIWTLGAAIICLMGFSYYNARQLN